MSLNLNNANDIICNSLKLIENGALVDINDKISSGGGYSQSEADNLFYTNTYLNTQLGLKASQADLTTTSNTVTNNVALISALQTTTNTQTAGIATNLATCNGLITQCDGIGIWSESSSSYVFHNPSVTQTGGDYYALVQHGTSGRTYLNGVGNLDLMVTDAGKIRMTSTTTTMDNTNTTIKTGGTDVISITACSTRVDGVNGVDLRHNSNYKLMVGASSTTIVDNVNAKKGVIIEGKDSDMVSDGFRQLRFINPFGGNTSLNNSWAMGCQNSAFSSSDNDFYFAVTRSGTETVTAYLQDSDLNEELDFTGQHRCLFQSSYTDDMIGLIVSSTGALFNLDGSNKPKNNESIPTVTLSSIAKDKKVFGVISGKESEENARTYKQGNFTSVLQKKDNTNRIYVNSVGEGAVLVSNESGDISNGDYVCSSSYQGYGMKQDDDILHNYTVAKITQDANFSSSEATTLPNGNKAMLVSCTYHCG